MNEAQSRGFAFEEEVRNFLKNLKFSDVAGGPKFKINGVQVDAVAGHEETLLVIECTTKRKLRDKISDLRGKIQILKKGFKKIPKYKKYKHYKFILATNLHNVSKKDIIFANKKPNIIIWDRKLISYYKELYKVIGEYARYNLLGELGVQPLVTKEKTIPAFRTKMGGFLVYVFISHPRDLLKVAYVARREVGKEGYYQRMIKKSRIKKIAEFIDNGGIFPNNIILCFEDTPKFIKINKVEDISGYEWPKEIEFGLLSFPNKYRSLWIIDGQHRLYSFSKSKKEVLISTLAFHKLKKEDQAGFFIEINKEQKPVDSNLLWDLEGEMRPNTERGIISRIAKQLNKDGPFKDKIYIPLEGLQKREIKLNTLCTTIEKLGLSKQVTVSKIKNPLYNKQPDKTVKNVAKAISNYFSIIEKLSDPKTKKNFVFTNGGISVLLMIYEKIITRIKKVPTQKDIEKYLGPLIEFLNKRSANEIKEYRLRCASEGGKKDLFNEFVNIIKNVDEKFASDVQPPYYDELRNFEKELRTKIIEIIKTNKTKEEDFIPQDVISKIKRHKDSNYLEFLDMGDCMKIIEKNWKKLFKKIFIENKKCGFKSKEEFIGAIKLIKHYRDASAHNRDIWINKEDYRLINIYMNRILECLSKLNKTF